MLLDRYTDVRLFGALGVAGSIALIAKVQVAGTAAGDAAERRVAARGAHVSNLEVAICAMAPWFLGTGFSTFTFTILEERRAVFGHVEGTGAEMVAKGALGWRLDLPHESAQSRLHPLPLPVQPPNLRIRPPRTVAEMRAMARTGQLVSQFLPERRRAIRRSKA